MRMEEKGIFGSVYERRLLRRRSKVLARFKKWRVCKIVGGRT